MSGSAPPDAVRQLLTTPVPVPERLFEDSPRCDGRTKMSKTDITGGGNAKALRATIKHRTSALQHCYDKALRTQPDLAGKMTYKIFISVMGTVTKVVIEEDSLGSAAVATCTETTIRGWRFPMNGADEGAEVTFSVVFSGS